MKNLRILTLAAVSALLTLCACAVDKAGKDAPINAEELVFAANPEAPKGRQDVYASMARSAKYNVDVASHNLNKKIYNQNPNLRPDDIIDNVVNSNINDENQLYRASRVLEFAVIYAVANLSDNRIYVDNYFYEQSAQHLALAAIRAHQDAWIAAKKIKELDRLMKQEQKPVEQLKQKEQRTGTLSAREYEWRKNQEVLLLKMAEMRKRLAFSMLEYGELTKIEPQKIELEGRRFYELEDFDKDYTIEIFQEAAVRNRKEFALAKEQVKSYAFNEVRRTISNRYPPVARLDVNGLTVENAVYEQELYDKALKIARSLLNAVGEFKRAKTGSAEQRAARTTAFDELGAAVLTQAEVSYQLVKLADVDFVNAAKAETDIKKEIHRLEKIYRRSDEEKLALLNARITLIEIELRKAQISAERAVALRTLYFNAGLSPLNKTLLKAPIKDISLSLKQAFNQNLIEMMSTVRGQMKALPQSEPQGGWAKGPNWLEQVVRSPSAKNATAAMPTPVLATEGKALLQLGSYEDRNNATGDWAELSNKFPELKVYQQSIEPAMVDGRTWFRLVLRGDANALAAICSRLQYAGYECLLRK